MPTQIKHLVFDMGGVLLEIDWHGKISKLLGKDIPFDAIHALWGASVSVNDFEHGRTDFDTFTSDFIQEQNLKLTPTEFKQEFMDIIVGDFPGVCELLASLQKNYTVSLLSNTNPAHWDVVVERNTFLKFVDNPFTSLQFGIMKPAPAIYERLIKELDCEPTDILFFDDGKLNVDAARDLGIHAEQVYGVEDVKKVLTDYGIRY
jgi:putative hydrolase of the HAD superfamily